MHKVHLNIKTPLDYTDWVARTSPIGALAITFDKTVYINTASNGILNWVCLSSPKGWGYVGYGALVISSARLFLSGESLELEQTDE
jgi:hypothetical protein